MFKTNTGHGFQERNQRNNHPRRTPCSTVTANRLGDGLLNSLLVEPFAVKLADLDRGAVNAAVSAERARAMHGAHLALQPGKLRPAHSDPLGQILPQSLKL